jgi:hypothetical protein
MTKRDIDVVSGSQPHVAEKRRTRLRPPSAILGLRAFTSPTLPPVAASTSEPIRRTSDREPTLHSLVLAAILLCDLRFVGGVKIRENCIRERADPPITVDQFAFLLRADEFALLRCILFVKVEREALPRIVHVEIRNAVSPATRRRKKVT